MNLQNSTWRYKKTLSIIFSIGIAIFFTACMSFSSGNVKSVNMKKFKTNKKNGSVVVVLTGYAVRHFDDHDVPIGDDSPLSSLGYLDKLEDGAKDAIEKSKLFDKYTSMSHISAKNPVDTYRYEGKSSEQKQAMIEHDIHVKKMYNQLQEYNFNRNTKDADYLLLVNVSFKRRQYVSTFLLFSFTFGLFPNIETEIVIVECILLKKSKDKYIMFGKPLKYEDKIYTFHDLIFFPFVAFTRTIWPIKRIVKKSVLNSLLLYHEAGLL